MKSRHAANRKCGLQLEMLESRTVLSGGAHGLGVALSHIPAEHGRGAAQVQTRLDAATDPAAEHRQDGVAGGRSAEHRQDAGHRQDGVHRPAAQDGGGQASARGPLDRAVTGLDKASEKLDRVASGAPAAARKGLDRAVTSLQRAATNLDRAIDAAPTSGLDAARTALERAISNLGRLEGQVSADKLEAIRATLQHALDRLPSTVGSEG